MDRTMPKWLAIIMIAVGMLFFFGGTTYKINNKYDTTGYAETNAVFIRATKKEQPIYDPEKKTTLYYLTYKYIVDDKEYYYTTNYSTSIIPVEGSTIEVKYNPGNPQQVYAKSFDTASIFRLIGAIFLFVSSIMLFSKLIWLRDIILILFSGNFIYVFISNKLYNGTYIIPLIVFLIMFVAGLMEFIKNIKAGNFHPILDIQNEIAIEKQLRLEKIIAKKNRTVEQINAKRKKIINKIKKIIISLLLAIMPLTLVTYMNIKIGFPNQTVYYIFVIIACLCFFGGFCMFGLTLMGFEPNKGVVIVGGKVIDNEVIENSKKMTFIEKLKAYNIINTVVEILFVILFVAAPILIDKDPLKLFKTFSNIGIFQLLSVLAIGIVASLYMLNSKYTKRAFIISIVILILAYILGYYNSIPNKEDLAGNKMSLTEFNNKMSEYGYSISDVDKIEGLVIENSEISLAQKDNMMIYYIVGERRNDIIKAFDSFANDFEGCSLDGMNGISGNYKDAECKEPSYYKAAYKINNTMVYGETTLEEKDKLEGLFKKIRNYN